MRAHGNRDIQISVRSAVASGFTLAGLNQCLTVIDAGRNLDGRGALLAQTARSGTVGTLVPDDLAAAAAVRAGAHRGHPAARGSDLTLSITGRAGAGLCPRLGTGAVAGIAYLIAEKVKRLLASVCRFLERQAHLIAQVIAPRRCIGRTS